MRTAVAGLALVVSLTACARTEPIERAQQQQCSPTPKFARGERSETIVSQGVERTYVVYLPPSYTGTKRAPLLFNFHGVGGSGDEQIRYADFRPFADRDGFIVVAPDGQGRARHFNLRFPGGQYVLRFDERETDDFTFVTDLLDHLTGTLCVDEARVYSTGFSNGGAMTSLLACRAGDRFAAFAPVASVAWSTCEGGRTAPVAAVMGTDDRVVPFHGGTVTCCGNPSVPPAPEMMSAWARHNGCEPRPDAEKPRPQVELRRWRGCDAATLFYVVHGGAHEWPSAGREAFDATETLWEFLSRHQLEPARATRE